jgi:putative chitinase
MEISKLKGHVPDKVLTEIHSIEEKFNINTPLRLAHFLAQTGHESGNFTITKENLSYSADRLQVIFKKYFTPESAVEYARKPEKIANIVYANRMGNGNQASGEGYKFCGRGFIQLTGKENYASFDKTVEDDILANPDLISTKYPLLSAAWFWNKNNLNTVADGGATDEVVAKITKRVNGGIIGLPDRIKHFNEFHNLLIGSI